jgi:hypothetical protein
VLKATIIVLSCVLVLFVVVGFFLPNDFRVESSRVVHAEPERVFAVVSDLRTWPEWTTWSHEFDPACRFTFEGAESGAGAVMRWTGDPEKMRTGELKLVDASADRGVAYELVFGESADATNGSIAFVAEGGGTRVTWTTWGKIGARPLGGWAKVLVDSYFRTELAKQFTKNLESLELRLAAAPQPAK